MYITKDNKLHTVDRSGNSDHASTLQLQRKQGTQQAASNAVHAKQ